MSTKTRPTALPPTAAEAAQQAKPVSTPINKIEMDDKFNIDISVTLVDGQ